MAADDEDADDADSNDDQQSPEDYGISYTKTLMFVMIKTKLNIMPERPNGAYGCGKLVSAFYTRL